MSLSLDHSRLAFVLVGGLGTRIQKVLHGTPKPLAPIRGRPFLDLLLNKLKGEGFTDVVLLAGHQGKMFEPYRDRSRDFGLDIEVVVEPRPLGTGGAVVHALKQMKESAESFLLVNGDTWLEGSLRKLREVPVSATDPLVLGLVYQEIADRYGLVERSADGRVERFLEKQPGRSGWINAGYVVLHRSLFENLKSGETLSLEKDIYPRAPRPQTVELSGTFIDIGVPEDYAQLTVDRSAEELAKKLPWAGDLLSAWLQHGTLVSSNQEIVRDLLQAGFDQVSLLPELDASVLRGLLERDVCIDRFEVSGLRDLNRCTSCVLVHRGPAMEEAFLVDAQLTEEEWDTGLVLLRDLLKELKELRWYYGKGPSTQRPALFLDRDGTLLRFVDYLADPKEVELRPEIVPVLRKAHEHGWAAICVTNQSGLGRGRYSWTDYLRVQKRMLELLAKEGVYLDHCLEAPFFRESPLARWRFSPSLRKPRGGMLQLAARRWGYQIPRSVMVGDSLVDLQAGTLAGVSVVVFVGPKDSEALPNYRAWLKNWQGATPRLIIDPSMTELPGLVGI